MNVATPKKREWPVIHVFVSSTFTDFKHERNTLHQKVFANGSCRARGFQFQAIDLPWGVPMEAAPAFQGGRAQMVSVEASYE